MPLFVTVLEGDTPETARTVLATRHPRILEAVRREIRACLSDAPNGAGVDSGPQLVERTMHEPDED